MTGEKLERVNRIWKHELFQQKLSIVEKEEGERIFCRHGKEHLLAVARLAWILVLEEGLESYFQKDVIYAAALLHDLGRSQKEKEGNHAREGAGLAGEILPDCAYNQEETKLVVQGILEHGGKIPKERWNREDIPSLFSSILQQADHDSRDCFCCRAAESCYWAEERRVKEILG